MNKPNKPTFERFSTFEELKGIKKPTVSEGVEPKNDLPDVESILKHKGMRSIEWAMQEYGRQLIDYVARNAKIKTVIPIEGGCRMFTDSYDTADRDAILAIKELITPQ